MGTILFCFICLVLGGVMYLVLTLFNPLPMYFGDIVPMVDELAGSLHSQFLTNPLITTILGSVGSGALINAIRSKDQSQKDAIAQLKQSSVEHNLIDKINMINSLEKDKQNLTQKIADQQLLQNQLTSANTTIEQKQKEIEDLQTEKKELERVLAQKTVIIEKTGVH